ncbi:MAG: hypothetical protein CL928_02820 [Deltaproteobacteria bacterium]|nr:hypothetical protein [Deltaproteobacteria bacterium]
MLLAVTVQEAYSRLYVPAAGTVQDASWVSQTSALVPVVSRAASTMYRSAAPGGEAVQLTSTVSLSGL